MTEPPRRRRRRRRRRPYFTAPSEASRAIIARLSSLVPGQSPPALPAQLHIHIHFSGCCPLGSGMHCLTMSFQHHPPTVSGKTEHFSVPAIFLLLAL